MTNAPLQAARDLGPAIAARSDEIEDLRTMPADLVDQIRPSQAFRQFVPESLDGPGLSPWDGLQSVEEFAYHDGSVGWCVAIASTSSLMASYLQPEFASLIYGDRQSITGGFAAPMGVATPVDGGLRVTGQWQWGSGTRHCTWVGGGCRVVGPDGKMQPREDGLAFPFVFFEPSDVEFLDTWHVAGLAGTGSTDYRVDDVFVPEGRWVQIGFDPPIVEGPLSQFSFYGLLALGIAATSVGIARRSIDELIDLAENKRPQGSSRPLRDRTPIQADVGRAEATLRSAWAFVADTVDDTWQAALAGTPATEEQKRLLRLAATHATQSSAEVAEIVYKAAGGAAVYKTSPIQRCYRDVSVALQHAMVAPRTYEVAGRIRLGLETDTRQL